MGITATVTMATIIVAASNGTIIITTADAIHVATFTAKGVAIPACMVVAEASAGLLPALLNAYNLDEPTRISLIYRGNNEVYRLDFPPGSRHERLAVKCATLGGEQSIACKHVEHLVLNSIRPWFRDVPDLITPVGEPVDVVRYPWGLLWKQTQLISVYQWIASVPYRGLDQQLRQVGHHYIQLQRALARVPVSALQPYLKPSAQQRFYRHNSQLILDRHLSFIPYQHFIEQRARLSPTFKLIRNNLDVLQQETEALRVLTQQHRQFQNTKALSLVHRQLSPSNIGFNADHTVAAVFDFDTVGFGLPLQDAAWLCATFCVDYRKSLPQVVRDLTILLTALQPALNNDWRELLLPFMRLAYIDAICRKLQRARDGIDPRMGYTREDMLCLRWLREHQQPLESHIQQILTNG
jgi:hypothetical protein